MAALKQHRQLFEVARHSRHLINVGDQLPRAQNSMRIFGPRFRDMTFEDDVHSFIHGELRPFNRPSFVSRDTAAASSELETNTSGIAEKSGISGYSVASVARIRGLAWTKNDLSGLMIAALDSRRFITPRSSRTSCSLLRYGSALSCQSGTNAPLTVQPTDSQNIPTHKNDHKVFSPLRPSTRRARSKAGSS